MASASARHALLLVTVVHGACLDTELASLPASSGSAVPLGGALAYCLPTSLQLAKYWEAFLPEAKAIS